MKDADNREVDGNGKPFGKPRSAIINGEGGSMNEPKRYKLELLLDDEHSFDSEWFLADDPAVLEAFHKAEMLESTRSELLVIQNAIRLGQYIDAERRTTVLLLAIESVKEGT